MCCGVTQECSLNAADIASDTPLEFTDVPLSLLSAAAIDNEFMSPHPPPHPHSCSQSLSVSSNELLIVERIRYTLDCVSHSTRTPVTDSCYAVFIEYF